MAEDRTAQIINFDSVSATERERRRFEDWATSHLRKDENFLARSRGGDYVVPGAKLAWLGWFARGVVDAEDANSENPNLEARCQEIFSEELLEYQYPGIKDHMRTVPDEFQSALISAALSAIKRVAAKSNG